jgi:cellulose biosynthesis protein BcsQ
MSKINEQHIQQLKQQWFNLDPSDSEANLNAKLTNDFWKYLGFNYTFTPTLGNGLKPDYIVYDQNQQPLLAVETKKRTPVIANQPEDQFIGYCQNHALYKSAIGELNGQNGIKQYLDIQAPAAQYGLVFNGDFFQLFRRVDGLIIPLTEIKRFNQTNLLNCITHLEHYLTQPAKAFVVSTWNRKGGVAKTTNCMNIAAVLAKKGKRVLLVDFDPQVDLTHSLGVDSELAKGKLTEILDKIQSNASVTAETLLKNTIQIQQFNVETEQYSLSLFPGNKDTLEYFAEQEGRGGYAMPSKPKALKKLLSLIAADYDYIFIDTSPKADILTSCSLSAADGLIIPSDYDPETLRHAGSIGTNIIPAVQKSRHPSNPDKRRNKIDDLGPHILGVVFSNCPDIGKKLREQVDNFLQNKCQLHVYQTELRQYQTAVLAKYKKIPVVFQSPTSAITKLYEQLTEEIFFTSRLLK